MDVKELRIGNWVEEEVLGIVKVSEIYRHVVLATSKNLNKEGVVVDFDYVLTLDNIQPISLTPEILEKCGIERTGNLANSASRKFYKIGKIIIESIYENRIAVYIDSETEFILIGFHGYLHQLQNLYYALTGEELIINL